MLITLAKGFGASLVKTVTLPTLHLTAKLPVRSHLPEC